MIKPTGHYLLIKPREVEEVTEGGIILTNETVERDTAGAEYGKVLAIGEDAWADKTTKWAEIGDTVYYTKYAGKVIFDKGERLLLMADINVMGKEASDG